jgi:hypothetical protein
MLVVSWGHGYHTRASQPEIQGLHFVEYDQKADKNKFDSDVGCSRSRCVVTGPYLSLFKFRGHHIYDRDTYSDGCLKRPAPSEYRDQDHAWKEVCSQGSTDRRSDWTGRDTFPCR